MRLSRRPAGYRPAGNPDRAVPTFTIFRLSEEEEEEEPDCVPAASPRVRRRLSPWPPARRFQTSLKFPHTRAGARCAARLALIYQI
ncbi:hypothetical protein FRAAL2650 [Frankia alni ACN14a]|uniref:Uncharacterized protein n=1 Tax=Frankia alni (strain DSM 45986 / CECT 9034 / ACN14a) TaxID=326424 RepID=Q0RMF5_FRAAA|nr:hypothetical protein FRAAL2650 [Frankia alni ACN14a]